MIKKVQNKSNNKSSDNKNLKLKLKYLNSLSKPVLNYEQFKNTTSTKHNENSQQKSTKDKNEKTVFTEKDFKDFEKNYVG